MRVEVETQHPQTYGTMKEGLRRKEGVYSTEIKKKTGEIAY